MRTEYGVSGLESLCDYDLDRMRSSNGERVEDKSNQSGWFVVNRLGVMEKLRGNNTLKTNNRIRR